MDFTSTISYGIIALVALIFGLLLNWVSFKVLNLKRPRVFGRTVVKGDGRSSTSLKDLIQHVAEPELLFKRQIIEKFPRDSWQYHAYDAFSAKLNDRTRIFPCIYATKGLRNDQLCYVFLDVEDPTTPAAIICYAMAILAYDHQSPSFGDNTSLVVLYPESNNKQYTVEDYHAQFWAVLKGIKSLDAKPWPGHINPNTSSPFWAMCFNGNMSFWAVLTPAHSRRKSRYLPNLVIVYQPRWIFEKLLSTDSKRKAALQTVRGLIDKYDDPLPRSPDLGNFGESGKSEAYQYFSMDENVSKACPYNEL